MRTLNVYSKQITVCVGCALSFTLSHMYNAHTQVPTHAQKKKNKEETETGLAYYRHSVCTHISMHVSWVCTEILDNPVEWLDLSSLIAFIMTKNFISNCHTCKRQSFQFWTTLVFGFCHWNTPVVGQLIVRVAQVLAKDTGYHAYPSTIECLAVTLGSDNSHPSSQSTGSLSSQSEMIVSQSKLSNLFSRDPENAILLCKDLTAGVGSSLLVNCCLGKQGDPSLIPNTCAEANAVTMFICKPSNGKASTGRSLELATQRVQLNWWALDSARPCFKTK